MGEPGQEVAAFNPDQIMQGVKDKIKATFVGMIPDEQWEQMVKKEIDTFFTSQDKQISRSCSKRHSQFQDLVWEELDKALRPIVREQLEKLKSHNWVGDGYVLNEAVEKMIKENANKIMATMIGSCVQNAINNMHIPGM